MMDIWDYLMRRKPLLLALLAVFWLSGMLGSAAVERMRTPVEIATGQKLNVPLNTNRPVAEVSPETPASAEAEKLHVPIVAAVPEIAVPATGGIDIDKILSESVPLYKSADDGEAEHIASLYATWQNVAYSTTLCLIFGAAAVVTAKIALAPERTM